MFGVLLGGKLIYLQLFMHGHYLVQAEQDQTRKYEIPATRGQIYTNDNGVAQPLALNQTLYVIYADPSQMKDRAVETKQLAGILGGSADDYLTSVSKATRYVELATRIPTTTANNIKALHLPGVGTTSRDYRTYPEGSLAAQVLGFVNADGAGQYGIEGYLNQNLTGTPGLFAAKTDTNGIPIQESSNIAKKPVDGISYVLTIDKNVQAEVEKELAAQVQNVKAKSGSVVILDPSNGKVVSMANYPTYDPNNYQAVTDYRDFANNVVSSAYEPGSTVKALTYGTGLDQSKITPDTTYNDPGFYTIDGYKVADAFGDVPGPNRTMTYALKLSLNTGAMYVLRTLSGSTEKFTLDGKKTLFNYFTNHFGLGVLTGIEQASEASGNVNQPSNAAGNDVNYANMTFGQGMTVTMIQMATAMASIANGGKLYQPTVIDGTLNSDGTIKEQAPKLIRSNVLSAQAAAQLNTMLQVTVHHGTGYIAAEQNAGYVLAGKTGSAQIPKPDGSGYIDGANIGSFLGYAPANNPKFVMMIRIDQPLNAGFAETTTVPLFSSLSTWLFKYYAIPPSGSYPDK